MPFSGPFREPLIAPIFLLGRMPPGYIPKNLGSGAAVLFSFDDGTKDAYRLAYRYMASQGLRGTCYIITDKIATAGYMSAANLSTLDAANWDIANHTNNHVDLTTLTEAQQEAEILAGKTALDALGLTRASLHIAYPFGNENADTLTAMAAIGAKTGRLATIGYDDMPISNAYLFHIQDASNKTLVQLEGYVDTVLAAGEVLILMFHQIAFEGASSTKLPYDIFCDLVDYVVAKSALGNFWPLTIDQLYNLLSGSLTITMPTAYSPTINTTYADEIAATESANLITHWPMWERDTGIADNYQGTAARDGKYIDVLLFDTLGPDGNDSIGLDALGLVNVLTSNGSTGLADLWNGNEFTIAVWAKVAAAGVWTDGVRRDVFQFNTGSNYVFLTKWTVNNQLIGQISAGGTTKNLVATCSLTTWMHLAVVRSVTGNFAKLYINGTEAATNTAATNWSGTLSKAIFGSSDLAGGSVWSGWMAHAAVWTKALTAPEIAALATV